MAEALPMRAERQPRTLPTARTTVRASTHSTREARKEAVMEVPICAQPVPIVLLLVMIDERAVLPDGPPARRAVTS